MYWSCALRQCSGEINASSCESLALEMANIHHISHTHKVIRTYVRTRTYPRCYTLYVCIRIYIIIHPSFYTYLLMYVHVYTCTLPPLPYTIIYVYTRSYIHVHTYVPTLTAIYYIYTIRTDKITQHNLTTLNRLHVHIWGNNTILYGVTYEHIVEYYAFIFIQKLLCLTAFYTISCANVGKINIGIIISW